MGGGGLARNDIPTACLRATLTEGLPWALCHLVRPLWVSDLVSYQAHLWKPLLRV